MKMDHVNIVVRDLEGAVTFYSRVMGMEQTFATALEGAWIESVTGLKDAQARCVFLQFPHYDFRLELLQYISPQAEISPHNSLAHSPGIRHLAFETNEMDVLIARLQVATVKFVSPPVTVPFPVGNRGTKRLCYFHDPDGTLLEAAAYSAAETSSPETTATTRDA